MNEGKMAKQRKVVSTKKKKLSFKNYFLDVGEKYK